MSQLNTDAFKEMVLKDLMVDYSIQAGKLFIEPFETKMGNTKLMVAGEQGFDKTMDYGINIAIPRSLLGSANTTVSNLAADNGINLAGAEELNLMARVTGDMANPKIGIDMKESLKGTKEVIKKQITETAKKELDTRKEDAKKAGSCRS